MSKSPRNKTFLLIEGVARYHGVTIEDIMSKRTARRLVKARRDAICAVANARPELSYPQLGKLFGLDHTTCLHHAQVGGVWMPRRRCWKAVKTRDAFLADLRTSGMAVKRLAVRYDVPEVLAYKLAKGVVRDVPLRRLPKRVAA